MSKLAKYKSNKGVKLAKKSGEGKKNKFGSTGLLITEVGSHAVLALASANYETVGPIPVRPDIFAAGIAGLAMAVTKKGNRKLAGSVLLGAAHAVITRFVGQKKVRAVFDKDGKAHLEEESVSATAAAA